MELTSPLSTAAWGSSGSATTQDAPQLRRPCVPAWPPRSVAPHSSSHGHTTTASASPDTMLLQYVKDLFQDRKSLLDRIHGF